MKTLDTILGVACGIIIGLAAGILLAAGVGTLSRWSSPEDPSAGSIMTIVIGTAPLGALIGALLGGLAWARHPRFLYAAVLPLAILLISFSLLLKVDRPRTFSVEVFGTSGAEYAGLVSVDGRVEKRKGTLPARFEFKGLRLAFEFALVHPDGKHSIQVKVQADGKDLAASQASQTGVYHELRSYGPSEALGGTSNTWSSLSEEEVEALVTTETMRPLVWEP